MTAMRRSARLAAALVVAAAFSLAPAAAGDGPVCRGETFEGGRFTICAIDLDRHELALFSRDASGDPFAHFSRLPKERDGGTLVFAMNAGMYDTQLGPIGLHIEDGETLKSANTRPGPGNFHMLPNGVFYVAQGRAGVATTQDYLARGVNADIATQSGPMLLVDGEPHPRFLPDSTSLRRRNGVCVRDDGAIVFAISDIWVNFHHFARLFRDSIGCRDALYLDGTMSSLYAPEIGRADAIRPMGPIIAAYRRSAR
ncbi:MAG: hypothetical protein EA385_08650 [Salinarimonadaceae bacterium]|nr:MAG: hypothetical protein EA385_08650 [Salinarimonadaceae bacterium]